MEKIVLIGISLRVNSLNKKLIANVERILNQENTPHSVELLSFNEFPMPVYDGDLEAAQGLPAGVQQLARKIEQAEGLILASPEYNGGIAGSFKNTIDWVSRIKPAPWTGKKILLLSASPGGLGGIRGLTHSRVPLEALGAYVFPEMFGLGQADKAFGEKGELKDVGTEERLKTLLLKFLNSAVWR
jgi:NAD(P)H-dependent FMN reductase